MMTAIIELRLREVLKNYVTSSDAARTTHQTRLVHDLRLSGEDVDELLTELARVFGTSFDGIVFKNYFPNEGEFFGNGIIGSLLGEPASRWRPVTIAHLIEVIHRGRWFDPVLADR